MKHKLARQRALFAGFVAIASASSAFADGGNSHECADLPSYAALKAALNAARASANGGFNLDMWGTGLSHTQLS